MTLPASGAISLTAICAEFGLSSNTPFPTGFYGLGGAPSSGALGFANFYGRAIAPGFTLSANRTALIINGFSGTQTATITSTGATTFTFSGATARCTASQASGTTATVTLTTPASGNGSVGGAVRVTATNGEYMDIAFNGDWGTA